MTHWTKRALAFIKIRTYPEYLTYKSGDAPTVRELALRYRVSQQEVVDALEDHESICMNIGLQIGDGVFEHKSIGDYNFEWLDN